MRSAYISRQSKRDSWQVWLTFEARLTESEGEFQSNGRTIRLEWEDGLNEITLQSKPNASSFSLRTETIVIENQIHCQWEWNRFSLRRWFLKVNALWCRKIGAFKLPNSRKHLVCQMSKGIYLTKSISHRLTMKGHISLPMGRDAFSLPILSKYLLMISQSLTNIKGLNQ